MNLDKIYNVLNEYNGVPKDVTVQDIEIDFGVKLIETPHYIAVCDGDLLYTFDRSTWAVNNSPDPIDAGLLTYPREHNETISIHANIHPLWLHAPLSILSAVKKRVKGITSLYTSTNRELIFIADDYSLWSCKIL